MSTDAAKKYSLVPAEEVTENVETANVNRNYRKTQWSTLDISDKKNGKENVENRNPGKGHPSGRGGRRGGRGRGSFNGNWRGQRRGRQYDALGGYFQDGVYVHPDLSVSAKYAVQQMEYYFSVENLCRDTYIRSMMDEEGYVPVALVANFPAVCSIHNDLETLLDALEVSEVLDLDRKNEKIRVKENWKLWLFPNAKGGFGVPLYIKLTEEDQENEDGNDETDEPSAEPEGSTTPVSTNEAAEKEGEVATESA